EQTSSSSSPRTNRWCPRPAVRARKYPGQSPPKLGHCADGMCPSPAIELPPPLSHFPLGVLAFPTSSVLSSLLLIRSQSASSDYQHLGDRHGMKQRRRANSAVELDKIGA